MSEPVQAFKVNLPTLKHPATAEQIADFLTIYSGLSAADITAAVFEKFPGLARGNRNVYAVALGWVAEQMHIASVALRELTPVRDAA